MNDSLLELLRRVDTPTVCNAIEVAQGKRGFNDFTRGTMQCSAPGEAMVGYARTARIQAVNPPTEAPDVIKARRMAYYKYMAEGPRPGVAVVQDLDVPYAIDAASGEIYTNVHKAFGLSGANNIPVSPWVMSSRCPPMLEAATSLPWAIASRGLSGVTSSVRRLALRG